jgi:transposase InsO family protein
MLVKLHANAATTPKVRAYIQASLLSDAELARELGVSATTVRRWRGRSDVADRASTPHHLATRFSREEEEIAVALRTDLGLSLDDVLEVMRRCLRADISRSALHRCLKRRGVSQRPAAPKAAAQSFAPTPFGYVHVDLKHLPRLKGQAAYVFVAIERTTRFVHAEIIQDRSGETVAACLGRFLEAFGHPVHTILTDNGSEFTDRFGDARWRRRDQGTGKHPFDKICQAQGVKHKLTRPYRPQTNGMVERFNRRLAEALRSHPPSGDNAGKNRFTDHHQRNAFVLAFVSDYNRTRLRCLGHKAPAEVLYNLPGHNTFAGMCGIQSDLNPLQVGRGP